MQARVFVRQEATVAWYRQKRRGCTGECPHSVCLSTLNRVEDAWGPKYLSPRCRDQYFTTCKTNWFGERACAERELDTSQDGDDGD